MNGSHCYYVNHPCHPLHGYRFELIRTFNSLGTLRVEFLGPDGQQLSLPASCTTVAADDPYVHFAPPGDLFRLPDLVALADLMHLICRRKLPSLHHGDDSK